MRLQNLLLTAAAVLALATTIQAADKNAQPVKYLRFQAGDTVAYGIVEGDRVRQISGDLFGSWKKTDKTHALDDVTLLVPTQPSKVLALAGNYKDHLGDKAPPEHPEPFIKLPSSLQQHEGNVVQPPDHEPVHFEAEVVIVISKQAKDVSEGDALNYVLGITCGNDISARYWQKNDVQWWRAKASDTFSPCGPFIVSGIDYANLDMELRVNGEVKQKTNTHNMIHNIPQVVSFISRYVTLEPGDLIYTGTPGQTVGMQPGDVVEVEIENVGILRNKIVTKE
jgi:2-keto-4-pentenoate hydratase/2-oxohepta-3-ene-1,7-dioic acid hydratase in catechol pathway